MAHRIPEKAPPEPELRVLPRGTALVPNYRALMEPPHSNRKVGWVFDPTLGPEIRGPQGQPTGQRHGGRVKQVDQVFVVAPDDPYRNEYVRHLKQGDLWCADKATADAVGMPFEPHFGGEHPATSAAHGLDDAKLRAALREGGFPEDGPAPTALFDAKFKPAVPPAESPKPAPAKASS